jgi:hypothetical protein
MDSIVDDHFATIKHREARQIQNVIIVQTLVINTNMLCDKKLLDLMIPKSVLANTRIVMVKAA